MKTPPKIYEKCPDCGNTHLLRAVHRTHYLYTECCKCCGFVSQPKQIVGLCCETPDVHKVKMYIADGRTQVREQCKNCGATSKESVSQKGLKLDEVPMIDLNGRSKADRLETTNQNTLYKSILDFKSSFKK